MHLIYDVSHNIAKVEEHMVDGKQKTLLVHRKGATRAFPPHHPLIPVDYQVLDWKKVNLEFTLVLNHELLYLYKVNWAACPYRWHNGHLQLRTNWNTDWDGKYIWNYMSWSGE